LNTYLIQQYVTPEGKCPFLKWYKSLDPAVMARVALRLRRFNMGNLGQTRHLGGNLHEAKMDFGPGYRVYFGLHEQRIVLLLCAGDKAEQDKDISIARGYWKVFQEKNYER